MRQVYVPFSIATRCALTDWHHIPSFHACAFAPNFADDAKLVVYTREDFDRWKGLLADWLSRMLARARERVSQRRGAEAPLSA
jgi:hypothetical protein